MPLNRGLPVSCLVAIFSLTCGLPRAALAQADREKSAARSAADAGGDAFDQGRYAEALELFGRAEQLVHAPPHLLFMARAREKLGKLVDAYETYMKVVKEQLPANAPNAFRQAQADAQAEIGALEARLARVTVNVRGNGAEHAVLSMDGVELPPAMIGIPFPIDPGLHLFSARAPQARSDEARFTFAEGERRSVALELQTLSIAPPSKQSPAVGRPLPASETGAAGGGNDRKTWAILALGAGVAAAGAGTYFTVSSLKSRGKANDIYACDDVGACSDAQKAQISKFDGEADRSRNWAIALYSAGVGGLVTGALLLSSGGQSAAQPSTSALALRELRLDLGLGWVGARGRF